MVLRPFFHARDIDGDSQHGGVLGDGVRCRRRHIACVPWNDPSTGVTRHVDVLGASGVYRMPEL